MENQNIRVNQVTVVHESEKNPRVVSLEGHKSAGTNSSAKKRQESSNLISKLPSTSKRKRIKTEPSTDSSSSKEVFPGVTSHPAKKKKYGKNQRRDDTSTYSDSSSSDGNDSGH